MAFQNPTGANDLLPRAAYGQQQLVRIATSVFGSYGYQYIETPSFERAEVFCRGIGEATDVVGKEMYYVYSLQGAAQLAEGNADAVERLALRPEGTAGLARAVVQHNLVPPGAPAAKLWYAGSMFRHERQQKGRYREFHQIGAECFGAQEPTADAEVILMLMAFFEAVGIPAEQMTLKLNSMGDSACRPAWQAAVRDFIHAHDAEFCPECLRRADTNPLRAFDCKSPACQATLAGAPRLAEYLCEDCASHYEAVRELLTTSGLRFEEDARLVRGFDYYTRTVFEVQVDAGLGAQNAIGGGGRYDRLLLEYGAKPTPSLGFAVGLERIMMVLEALDRLPEPPAAAEVFVAAVDEEARPVAFTLAAELRAAGVRTELDHQARSLKSQFKVAGKTGVSFVVVVGPDEIAQGRFTLRSMTEHAEQTLTRDELLAFLQASLSDA
jgi:histidyl-tRNA synthetase